MSFDHPRPALAACLLVEFMLGLQIRVRLHPDQRHVLMRYELHLLQLWCRVWLPC